MELWLTAASLKLPVFPCSANKKPTCPHGFLDATSQPQQIRDLFTRYPGSIVGVPTGATSGLDALDTDTTRHKEAADWLNATPLPATRIHQTASGGRHYIFQHRVGLRNWTSRPVPGVDGRGDGGYICWWPASGYATNGAVPAAWPDNLLQQFEKPKPSRQEPHNLEPINDAKLSGVLRRITNAVNGERNDLLFWGSCRVAEWIDANQLTRSAGERLLRMAAEKLGLPYPEAERTINSAFTHKDRHG